MPSTGNIFDVQVLESGEIPFDSGLGSGSTLQAGDTGSNPVAEPSGEASTNGRSPAVISQPSEKQRIDAEMRQIFRSSTFTTLDPADDPRFA